MNYTDALDRAIDAMPDRTIQSGSRLTVPDPEGETDGAFTRLTNIGEISNALGREAEHLHSHFQQEFATSGQFEDGRGRYSGSFDIADFDAAIEAYVDEFVTCSECGLPDTRLVREDGVDMLRCEACGAFRPVNKGTSTNTTSRETLEERQTYRLEVTDTGRKGDGVAHHGEYTVFVSGAQEGQVVDAYIKNISGKLAFARVA
jgi:translation initiation factor 2 subunit 2